MRRTSDEFSEFSLRISNSELADSPRHSFDLSGSSSPSMSSNSSGRSETDEQSDGSDQEINIIQVSTSSKEHGSQRRRWMEDSNEPGCFINYPPLDHESLVINYELDWPVKNVKTDVILESQELCLDPSLDYIEYAYTCDAFLWSGYIARGAIVIEELRREKRLKGPYMSQVSYALYTSNYSIESLKHVYVSSVDEYDTYPLIQQYIYGQTNQLTWPDSGEQTWDIARDADVFDMLIGTRIGKLVSYLVLGGFDRGTRSIARIVTRPSRGENAIHMRFDIE